LRATLNCWEVKQQNIRPPRVVHSNFFIVGFEKRIKPEARMPEAPKQSVCGT